jgi:uncharacterized membrane protein
VGGSRLSSLPSAAVSRPWRLVAAIVAATALTCGVGIGVRMALCNRPCTSDLPRLYAHRGIRPGAAPYVDRNLEYPVLIGDAFWVATFVARSPRSFFLVTASASTVLAMLTAGLLALRYGRRAWYFALAPPLALYASANWDLFAVAPAVGGLIASELGLDLTAGVLIGVGAAAKLYPGVFLVPLVAARLRARDRRGAVRIIAGALGALAALNLPVLALSVRGWLYPLRFQSRRTATWGSLWHYAVRTPALHPWIGSATARSLENVGAVAVVVAGLAAVGWAVWRGLLGAVAGAAVATAVFLLANKVWSPQYDLWLVPFFVMLALPRRDYFAWVALDAAVFAFVFSALGHHFRVTTAWAWVLAVLVVARAAVLVLVIVDAGRGGPGRGDVTSLRVPGRPLARASVA